MTRKVVSFTDFSGGEYGTLDAFHAPANSFTGTNVVRYIDGSLGPRSGLKDMGATGVPNGRLIGMGLNYYWEQLWWIIGDTAYDISASSTGSATRTYTGTLAAPQATYAIRRGSDASQYSHFTSYGDQSYYLDTINGTLGALTSSPQGRTSVIFGDRLFIVSPTGANPVRRVYYSAPADFNTWPAANYFDVGYPGSSIVAAHVTRGRLAFCTSEGKWWLYAGTPGYNDVLREQVQGLLPANPQQSDVSPDGTVWFLQDNHYFPVAFTGSGLKKFEHLSLINNDFDLNTFVDSNAHPIVGVSSLRADSDVVMVVGAYTNFRGIAGGNQALLYRRGVWTKHSFGVSLSGFVDSRLDLAQRVILTDGGDTSTPAKFYVWTQAPDRPPMTDSTLGELQWESIGDNSSSVPVSASFSTPEWWSKDGSEVQPVAVIIDFKKWNHGFSVDNNFTVALTPLRWDGGSAAVAGGNATAVTVGTFTEDPASASTSGTQDRRRWTLDPQFANGFQITVSSMVGVAVQKIHVVHDVRPMQGV